MYVIGSEKKAYTCSLYCFIKSKFTHCCNSIYGKRCYSYMFCWKLIMLAIFWIFKMAAATILDCWISEILLAIGPEKVEMHQHAKLRQSVAKILRLFHFSRWRPRPSWIVEFTKFYWLTVSGGHRRIIVPNFVKSGRSFAELHIVIFWIFEMASATILDFEIVKFYWLLC